MRLYKLTDKDGYTRKGELGETQWSPGFTLTLPTKQNPKLCSPDVVHAYTNQNLALLLNPCHANLSDPLLWEAEGDVCCNDWGKVGVFSLTTEQSVPRPQWYENHKIRPRVRVQFAILCAEAVLTHFESRNPNDNRPRQAIAAAKEYLENPSADAAYAASRAAYAAAYAAYAASRAASTAADAAYAASRAADADRAAYAAYASIDFSALADLAVQMEWKALTCPHNRRDER